MSTLKEDITSQSDWTVKAFAADGLKLDYSIGSLMEIDRFFLMNLQNGSPKKGGRLSKKGAGQILFSIAAYIGEVIIKNIPEAKWITDDNDPQGEINISIKLPNGSEIFPVQKVVKRFQVGSEESIYPYVHTTTKEFTQHTFNEKFWDLEKENENENTTTSNKPWWKFW
jgi:hypothetical protein